MSNYKPPDSILILGAGVFGLSTAYSLAKSPTYSSTKLTLVSYTFPIPLSDDHSNSSISKDTATRDSGINNPATARMASVDNSRIIRPDYAHMHYAHLAAQAQEIWRHGELGKDGRYSESGLVLVDNGGAESYAQQSLANVLEQAASDSTLSIRAEPLESDEAFRGALRNGEEATKLEGKFAYVNQTSGWADAGAAMRWLQGKVMETGRVEFVQAEVERLVVEPGDYPHANGQGKQAAQSQHIAGARLKSSAGSQTVEEIKASLTILAAGAWTPSLLEMTGIAEAHIQCALYLSLTDAEASRLKDARVLLNLDHGCFYFPPAQTVSYPNSNETQQSDTPYKSNWSLKLARHAHGYINPISIPRPPGATHTPPQPSTSTSTPSIPQQGTIKISLPPTKLQIPQRDTDLLLSFAEEHIPSLRLAETKSQRNIKTRHCTYIDTRSGDFIVSYHPTLDGVFVVTGGSGHGFKFLPVIGDKVVGVLEGREEEKEWAEIWRWPGSPTGAAAVDNEDHGVWCEDGSRSGQVNEVLSDYPTTRVLA